MSRTPGTHERLQAGGRGGRKVLDTYLPKRGFKYMVCVESLSGFINPFPSGFPSKTFTSYEQLCRIFNSFTVDLLLVLHDSYFQYLVDHTTVRKPENEI